jgi:hypothetical protein
VNCLASSSYGGAADEGRYGFGFESTSTLERPDGSPHTEQPLPTAAPHHDAVRCLLAIELSKASWVVAVHGP